MESFWTNDDTFEKSRCSAFPPRLGGFGCVSGACGLRESTRTALSRFRGSGVFVKVRFG